MARSLLALVALGLSACSAPPVRVLSFKALQGEGDSAGAALARVIHAAEADVVGVQEDAPDDSLLDALGEGWRRAGDVYVRGPVDLLEHRDGVTVARVTPRQGRSFVVVNVHWRSTPYGPLLLLDALREASEHGPEQLVVIVGEVLAASDKSAGARGWNETIDVLRPLLAAGERLVVVGSFNEPCAQDWRARPFTVEARRELPPGEYCSTVLFPWFVPTFALSISVPWCGSLRLAELGLRDAYRVAHPDVAAHPGFTWPIGSDGAPGLPPVDPLVPSDRVDWILVGPDVEVSRAWLVGERGSCAELQLAGDWPSDHRAVLAELRIPDRARAER